MKEDINVMFCTADVKFSMINKFPNKRETHGLEYIERSLRSHGE